VAASAFDVLGISPGATEDEIRAAWKTLALSVHPDHGGSHHQMVRLNLALEEALREHALRTHTRVLRRTAKTQRTYSTRDISSFTVHGLPVDAFETMTLVAAQCGQITDEDPPYLIEFTLVDSGITDAGNAICRCELMPEAGATTVHLGVSGCNGFLLEDVRDLLVNIINLLDI
jgi:DnaJ domain